jgi:hypothetical protein
MDLIEVYLDYADEKGQHQEQEFWPIWQCPECGTEEDSELPIKKNK